MAKLNKKEILLRIITPPKSIRGAFWSREYKILNKLMLDFPDEKFWQKVTFNLGWDSICILQTEYGQGLLKRKYQEFHYKIPKHKKIKLTNKSGDDKILVRKPKTLRRFLDE